MGLIRNLDAVGRELLPALILQRFASSEWVAYLRIAQRIVNSATLFMHGVSRTVLPALGTLSGLEDPARLRRVFFKVSLSAGFLISCGMLIVLPFLPWIIESVFPSDYHEPVWTLCLILTPGVMLNAFSVANTSFHLATDTLDAAIKITLWGTLFYVPLLVGLPLWNTVIGVAIALSFSSAWGIVYVLYAWRWFKRNEALQRAEESLGI